MALTKHQLKHLNAILNEQVSDKSDSGMMSKLRLAKGKSLKEYDVYINGVEASVKGTISSGVWPKGVENPSDIHDYLEVSN